MKIIKKIILTILLLVINQSTFAATGFGLYNLSIPDEAYLANFAFNPANLTVKPENALLFAKISDMPYQKSLSNEDKDWLDDNGFQTNNAYSPFQTFYPLKFLPLIKNITINNQSKQLVVLSFKGTSWLPDYLLDASYLPTAFYDNPGLQVHGGFHNGYFKLIRENEDNIDIAGKTLSQHIDNSLITGNTYFVLTGHSLGGAVAKLYAASLRERGIAKENILVYTYGAPPVGYNGFYKRYNMFDANAPVPINILESSNQLDPIFNISYLNLPYTLQAGDLSFLSHIGLNLFAFDKQGNRNTNTGCSPAHFVTFKVIDTKWQQRLEPCNLLFPAHSLSSYISNIYNIVDLHSIAKRLAEDGQAGINFTESELLVIEMIITNPKYSHAITGKTFDSTKLSAALRKTMIQELRAAGVPIGSSNYGALGEQIQLSLKNVVDKRKNELDAAIAKIDSTQALGIAEYEKLTFGSAINTISAVSDVLSGGLASTSKIVINTPIITGKLAKVASLSTKATPLMVKAIKLSQTKTFIFLKTLIEANFAINDDLRGTIDSDAATAEMLGSVIGAVGQLTNQQITDRITNKKSKLAVLFITKLNDIITAMIKGSSTAIITDQELKLALTQLFDSVLELTPYAGPYYAQWNMAKRVSDQISSKPEVIDAWNEYNALQDAIQTEIKYVGKLGFIKKLDIIVASALNQIQTEAEIAAELAAEKLAVEEARQKKYNNYIDSLLKLDTITAGQEFLLNFNKNSEYYAELMASIQYGYPIKLRYVKGNLGDGPVVSFEATYNAQKGGFVFSLPTTEAISFYEIWIPQPPKWAGDTKLIYHNYEAYKDDISIQTTTKEFVPPAPGTCPTGSTDIACKVGIYSVLQEVEYIKSRVHDFKVFGNFSYRTNNNNIIVDDLTNGTTFINEFAGYIGFPNSSALSSGLIKKGNYIYTIASVKKDGNNIFKLLILDAGNPKNLQVESAIEISVNYSSVLLGIKGSSVYTYTHSFYGNYINIINVNNPGVPVIKSTINDVMPSNESVIGAVTTDNYIYQLTRSGSYYSKEYIKVYLKSLNLSTGKSNTITVYNNFDYENTFSTIKSYNNKLYISGLDDYGERTLIYSLSDPENPTLYQKVNNIGFRHSVIKISEHEFLETNDGTVINLDTMTKSNISLNSGSNSGERYAYDNGMLYFLTYRLVPGGTYKAFIEKIDLTNKDLSSIKYIVDLISGFNPILLDKKYIFQYLHEQLKIILKDFDGTELSSINTSNLTYNEFQGFFKLTDNLIGVQSSKTIESPFLYALDLYDLTDKKNPQLLSTIFGKNGSITPTIYKDNFLYTNTGNNQLNVYNLMNLKAPVLTSTLQLDSTARHSIINGNILYLSTSGYSNALKILDINDKNNIKIISEINIRADNIAIKNNVLYVVGTENLKYIPGNLLLYNISSPEKPTLLKKHVFESKNIGNVLSNRISPFNLVQHSNFMYFATNSGIFVLDTTMEDNPKNIGVLEETKSVGSRGSQLGRGGSFESDENYLYVFDGRFDNLIILDTAQSISNLNVLNQLFYMSKNISLISEAPKDYEYHVSSFTKSWTFSEDISNYIVSVINNTYENSITESSFIKSGKILSVRLNPNLALQENKLDLKFTIDNKLVKVNGSDAFWSLTKTNHAPQFADGQITQMISGFGETASLIINIKDFDGDTLDMSILDTDGGIVTIAPNNRQNLLASFNDNQPVHTIKIRLNDGKESVIKSINVLRFDTSSIKTFYSDVDPASPDYLFDGIAFATLKGIIGGQADPLNPQQRIFRPMDNVSMAEALAMVVNAGQKAGLIVLPDTNTYLQTRPAWAMPYYTFARQYNALETDGDNLSNVYPSREEVARLIVKTLQLDIKLKDFPQLNIGFSDAQTFSDALMTRYGNIAHFFGLFMTDTIARAQSKVTRAELAAVIQKIFMMPTATLSATSGSYEFGDPLALSLSNIQAEIIDSNYILQDNSSRVSNTFFNHTGTLSLPLNTSTLSVGKNRLYSIVQNNQVSNVIYKDIIVTFTDSDNDGLQDRNDAFPYNPNELLDSDDDLLPDSWELAYGLNPFDATDAYQDADNDGSSNLAEYQQGTMPLNSQSTALTNGVCGISHTSTFSSKPSINLCTTGIAGSVSGKGPWNWICPGSGGGYNASCFANIQSYNVSTAVSTGGTISPDSYSVFDYSNPVYFTIVPDTGYRIDTITGSCGGILTQNTYTTKPVTSDCNISVNFTVYTEEIQQQAFIERFYQNILGRTADSGGMTNWKQVIQTESATKVALGFFNSPEFLSVERNNTDFLYTLYQTLFDRLPDDGGFNSWMEKLNNGELRSMVIYEFLRSQEFKNLSDSFNVSNFSSDDESAYQISQFVKRFYTLVLNRQPDTGGFNDWNAQLNSGNKSGGDIATGFFMSAEFTNRQTDDNSFLDIAYRAFFDREADTGGKENWLTAISNGSSRMDVINGFINSLEFSNLTSRFGITAVRIIYEVYGINNYDPEFYNNNNRYVVYDNYTLLGSFNTSDFVDLNINSYNGFVIFIYDKNYKLDYLKLDSNDIYTTVTQPFISGNLGLITDLSPLKVSNDGQSLVPEDYVSSQNPAVMIFTTYNKSNLSFEFSP